MKSLNDALSLPKASASSNEAVLALEPRARLSRPGRPRRHLAARSTLAWLLGAVIGLALIGAAIVMFRERRAVDRDARATRDAMAAGRPGQAREPLRRWLHVRPTSAEAHALSAEVALAEGDFRNVKSEYDKARALGHPEAKLERIRAIWWARLGRYAEAEPTLYRLWTEQTKSDPAVLEALAKIYLKTYRLQKATTVIERWIADVPADGRPLLWLTEIDRRTEVDNSGSWERHYREALRRDPDLDPARLGLAESLRKIHRNEEAAQEYTQYLARHPDDHVALAGAGLNALETGEHAEAVRFLDRAVALAPTQTIALKARAQAAMHVGDHRSARRYLDQAVAADRFDDEAFYLRSRVATLLGDSAGAAADCVVFDRLKHEQADLLRMHGQLWNHPEDNDTRSRAAAWLFAHGREQDGLEWSTAILASNPNHAPTCRLLADFYGTRPDGAGLANFYRLKATSGAQAPQ